LARTEASGTLSIAVERMQPVEVSNNQPAIAVPFGCKVIVQIPRESSLCTDGSHGDRAMEGIYVRVDDSTSSIHVHSKLTRWSCFQLGKHFETIFLFRDLDLLFDKSHLLSKRCQAHASER